VETGQKLEQVERDTELGARGPGRKRRRRLACWWRSTGPHGIGGPRWWPRLSRLVRRRLPALRAAASVAVRVGAGRCARRRGGAGRAILRPGALLRRYRADSSLSTLQDLYRLSANLATGRPRPLGPYRALARRGRRGSGSARRDHGRPARAVAELVHGTTQDSL